MATPAPLCFSEGFEGPDVVELMEADEATFAWLQGAGPAPAGAPPLCEGGLAPEPVMAIVAEMAERVRPLHAAASAWLVVADGEENWGSVLACAEAA